MEGPLGVGVFDENERLPLKIAAWLEGSDQFGEIPELNYSSTDQSQEA